MKPRLRKARISTYPCRLYSRKIVKKHKRILYNGDNYTEEWHKEAAKCGLPNLKTTPEALEQMVTEEAIAIFEKHKVLSKVEVESRYEIYKETYEKIVKIEAGVALEMAKTLIIPAALKYQGELAATVSELKNLGKVCKNTDALLDKVNSFAEKTLDAIAKLDKASQAHEPAEMLEGMRELRVAVDNLEEVMPTEFWPLPSYTEMMFVM